MQYSNIKIYYINLDRSIQRRRFMEKQFNDLGISATRVSAVDGTLLDSAITDPIYRQLNNSNEHYSLPSKAEIACYFSHIYVWNIIVQQTEEFALVLEDDVLLKETLFQDIAGICRIIASADIVDISGKKGFYKLQKRTINHTLSLIQYSTPPLGAFGKIIGKKAAQRLIEALPNYNMPVDTMIQQVRKHHITIWSTDKTYVTLSDHHLGGSTIQGIKKKLRDKLWRELSRPFYRLRIIILNLLYNTKGSKTPH